MPGPDHRSTTSPSGADAEVVLVDHAAGSSPGHVAAALQLLRITCRGATIAVVICDSGLKYMSTGLWAGEIRQDG